MIDIKDDNNGLRCKACGIEFKSFPANEYSFEYVDRLRDRFILFHNKCIRCMVALNEAHILFNDNLLPMLAYAFKKEKNLSIYKFSKIIGVDYKALQSAVRRMSLTTLEWELNLITIAGIKNQLLMMFKIIDSIKLIDCYNNAGDLKKIFALDWESRA